MTDHQVQITLFIYLGSARIVAKREKKLINLKNKKAWKLKRSTTTVVSNSPLNTTLSSVRVLQFTSKQTESSVEGVL